MKRLKLPGRAMTDLTVLSAFEAAAQIARGRLSAEDYTRACLDRIAALEPKVHAFIHLDPDYALEQARVLDQRQVRGHVTGPLHGIPVAIKDVFDTFDFPTECGSPLMKGRRPARDAAAVARLRGAGAVIVGKTVTTEFAYFHPGATRNPHDPSRTPGGSSSGSAAAVAAQMVPLAIGTQTNGSVIRPAAFCGVVGVKPSHGLNSRHGCLLLSRTLDHVGVFARSLTDAALILGILAGFDANDPDSSPGAPPDFEKAVEAEPKPRRLAFVRTQVWDKADLEARNALEDLARRVGAETVDLDGSFAGAWDDHRVVMATDMAQRFGEIVSGGRQSDSSEQLRELLAEGAAIPALRYLAARDNRARYRAGLGRILTDYDAILTPAVPGVAPKGEATGNPAFNSLWSLTGLPTLTLPLLQGEGGMPLGVQLVCAPGDDAKLMRVARWLLAEVGAGL
jgi:Asp-tRNA(Asn)/Glu-tRNA(Gln) amidotransferase A subunit family amidase